MSLPILQSNPLPPLYAAWIEALLAGPLPQETQATCQQCAMLPPPTTPAPPTTVFFHPETKCCTYIPVIPNFLVGGMLRDTHPASAAGRTTVVARLQAGIAVTPLGLGQPPGFSLPYTQSSASLFGHSRSLRCPHYLDGQCGVWRHRAAICATWHCKYVRGEVGRQFWRALQRLLSRIETSLTHWCVLELDPGPVALHHLFAVTPTYAPPPIDSHALDGVPDLQRHQALWGRWAGREVEFYQACAQRVVPLTWSDVLALGGPELKIAVVLTQQAYAALCSEALPPRLTMGTFQVVGGGPGVSRLTAYSRYDPLELPHQLLRALHHFDGRPTAQALEALTAATGLRLSPGLVRKLTDFGILGAQAASDSTLPPPG